MLKNNTMIKGDAKDWLETFYGYYKYSDGHGKLSVYLLYNKTQKCLYIDTDKLEYAD